MLSDRECQLRDWDVCRKYVDINHDVNMSKMRIEYNRKYV